MAESDNSGLFLTKQSLKSFSLKFGQSAAALWEMWLKHGNHSRFSWKCWVVLTQLWQVLINFLLSSQPNPTPPKPQDQKGKPKDYPPDPIIKHSIPHIFIKHIIGLQCNVDFLPSSGALYFTFLLLLYYANLFHHQHNVEKKSMEINEVLATTPFHHHHPDNVPKK